MITNLGAKKMLELLKAQWASGQSLDDSKVFLFLDDFEEDRAHNLNDFEAIPTLLLGLCRDIFTSSVVIEDDEAKLVGQEIEHVPSSELTFYGWCVLLFEADIPYNMKKFETPITCPANVAFRFIPILTAY